MVGFFAKISFRNSTQRPRIVWVEPWGEDFTLLPEEELLVVGHHETEIPWFSVVEWDDSTQVYLEATSDFEVLQNGGRIKCGHNRQAAFNAGLKF